MPRKKRITYSPEQYAERELRKALEKVAHIKKSSVLEHAVKKAYASDGVLIALLKHILPKTPLVDNSTTNHMYNAIKVIIEDSTKKVSAEKKSTLLSKESPLLTTPRKDTKPLKQEIYASNTHSGEEKSVNKDNTPSTSLHKETDTPGDRSILKLNTIDIPRDLCSDTIETPLNCTYTKVNRRQSRRADTLKGVQTTTSTEKAKRDRTGLHRGLGALTHTETGRGT